jgi:hypothetical protein
MMSFRRVVVRGFVAPALSRRSIRAAAFHFVSQLGIHYRKSPAVAEGEPKRPRAAARRPTADAKVLRDEQPTYLQQARQPARTCCSVVPWRRGTGTTS